MDQVSLGLNCNTGAQMKKQAKRSAPSKLLTPGEHIRVVPLHYPKPTVSIDEITRARDAGGGQDPFVGQPQPAPASAHLTYQGGALIPQVQVFTLFWGKLWGASLGSQQMRSRLNQFFTAIVASPLIDQLGEYSVPGQTIGHGSFI